jgi:hypothetical protein
MRKIYLIPLLMSGLIACNPDNQNPESDPTVILNTDLETFNNRFSLEGSGVVGIVTSDFISGRIMEEEEIAGKVPLMMVSQVNPPKYEGYELTATHVDIFKDFAYVSYNTAGPVFLGAIEIFDISDPLHPKIKSQAIFKNADINSLNFKDGILYAAAAFDVDKEPGVKTAAQLVQVSVSNGSFTSDFFKYNIEGFAAVDVTTNSDHIAVASGSNGLVGLFNPKGEIIGEFPLSDLRAVKFGNEILAVLSGNEGIRILNPKSLQTILSIPLEKDIAESKRTLDMAPGLLLASEGLNGVGVYSINSGALIQRLPILLNPDGVEAGDIVTNAVSYDDGKVYMANGGAGVSVSQLEENDIFEEIGILGISGSSNFIKSYNGYIFVASGRKGLQILSLAAKDELALNPEITCDGFEPYSGSANLNVNSNEKVGYTGSTSLKNVNIGGEFTFCGSLAIENNLNLNSGGLFQMNGSFVFGQFNRDRNLNINSNATMRIFGDMVIYGNLNLNSGATLEFVGEGNKVTIFGNVNKSNSATIKGNFVDTEGKLK